MPLEWLQVIAHPTTKDKASLLQQLKYNMTIDDVFDLMEYQSYENWMSWEEESRNNRESFSHN